jgi:hypothetical protein
MSTNPTSLVECASAGARVRSDWLFNNKSILSKLANALAGVGGGDFRGLVGIEPDLALAHAEDRRSKTLLSAEVDPVAELGQQSLFRR